MPAWLLPLLLFGKPMVADPALHKIDVHIAGPLAMVEVWRTLEANVRTENGRQVGSFLDLALPEGAALLDGEIIEGRVTTRLSPQSEVEANAALAAGLKLRRLSAPAPVEEGTDLRVHVTPIADGERAILHVRYSALAACQNGRLVLRVPESLEENPAPAEVTLAIEPLPDRTPLAALSLAGKSEALPVRGRQGSTQGSTSAIWRAVVPPRPAWEIVWSYGKATDSLPGTAVVAAAQVPRVRGEGGKARKVPQYELAGLVCRSDGGAQLPPLDQVVLVVDRSRSVGQGGLSAERRLARAVVEALPPSIPFAAILFGATAEPVFRLPRLPTREALDGFTRAADPNRLENGTDLVAALTRTRAWLGSEGPGRAWVVLVTDGALPSSQTGERMQEALAGKGGPDPKVLVLLVRQHGDEAVPARTVAEYARFARRFGGLVRVVDPASPVEVARDVVAAMGKGGDLLDVRLEDGKLTDALAPGQGRSLVLTSPARLPRDQRVRVQARGLDSDLRAELTPVLVKREWMDALVEGGASRRRAWAGATSGMAVAVLPGPAPAKSAADGVVRGRMDPVVLKNSLALAFTPRARACYVSRRVAKAGDADLRGRLKLELNLERGELEDAVVRQSTLDNPAIEDCVRRAAWAVEYPRPEHRDAPTIANLNLVFAPRTARELPPDASAADREIELIVGPVTFPEDYQDLLAQPPADKSPKP